MCRRAVGIISGDGGGVRWTTLTSEIVCLVFVFVLEFFLLLSFFFFLKFAFVFIFCLVLLLVLAFVS